MCGCATCKLWFSVAACSILSCKPALQNLTRLLGRAETLSARGPFSCNLLPHQRKSCWRGKNLAVSACEGKLACLKPEPREKEQQKGAGTTLGAPQVTRRTLSAPLCEVLPLQTVSFHSVVFSLCRPSGDRFRTGRWKSSFFLVPRVLANKSKSKRSDLSFRRCWAQDSKFRNPKPGSRNQNPSACCRTWDGLAQGSGGVFLAWICKFRVQSWALRFRQGSGLSPKFRVQGLGLNLEA